MKRNLGTLLVAGLLALAALVGAGPAAAAEDNTAPVAAMRSPVDGSFFVPGRAIAMIGSARDAEDAEAALTFQWTVDLVHADGVERGFFAGTGPSVFFTVEDLDEVAGVSLDVTLTVTDRGGLADTVIARVQPKPGREPAYPLGLGDVLDLTFYAGGEKQEQFTAEVSAIGTITSPLLGELSVGGLTAAEVSDKLTDILARDYFVNPQVLVGVRDHAKKIFVGGEVKQPGAYSIREGSTVLNACILAGGFTDFAALNRVTVTRTQGKQTKIIKLDLKDVQKGRASDLALENGDRVDVPHRMF